MKRIGDLDGVGQHRVEHRPIRGRQIQRRPPDPVAPAVGPGGEPGARLGRCRGPATTSSSWPRARRRSGSTTTGSGSGRPGRTASRPTRPRSTTPNRSGSSINGRPYTMTASITVCQSQPSSTATSATRATVPADLHRRPPRQPASSARTATTRSADRSRSTTGAHDGHRHRRLRPHQPRRAAERRQIDQRHLAATMTMRRRRTPGTDRPRRASSRSRSAASCGHSPTPTTRRRAGRPAARTCA